jgi:hypothetical protein
VKPGIYTIPADEYHRDPTPEPSLSASIAHLLVKKTPAHARWAHPRLNPDYERTEKAIFDLGNMAHAVLLENTYERIVVVEADSWRTKLAQEERDEARDRGFTPVLRKDYDRLTLAIDAIRKQISTRNLSTDYDPPLFSNGGAEQTIVWQERGVWCRALVDWLRGDFRAIDDLKTTSASANPVLWSKRTLEQIGADVQFAFYRRGVKALTGKTPAFRWVIAEIDPPFPISVVSLDTSWVDLADLKVDRAIERWRQCIETDTWPGYPESIYYAEPPAWVEYDFLEMDGEALAGRLT